MSVVLRLFLYVKPCRYKDVRLVLLGSCRNEADENILSTLRKNASSLGITDSVDFVVNAPFERYGGLVQFCVHDENK